MDSQSPQPPSDADFRAIGYQKWRNLLFLHWRIPAETLQPLLPDGLTVHTFDGDAWIGLVPFDMRGVRPKWLPPVPGISFFNETNVRTYVTRDGEDPGVWFFSLDAAGWVAVRIARWKWHLNYFYSHMSLKRDGDRIAYHSKRRWPEPRDAESDIEAVIGEESGAAEPGTLDHFLVERYVLYAEQPDGRLLRGQVHHKPYPLKSVSISRCEESLIAACGIQVTGDPVHATYSEGVDVEIGPLQPITAT